MSDETAGDGSAGVRGQGSGVGDAVAGGQGSGAGEDPVYTLPDYGLEKLEGIPVTVARLNDGDNTRGRMMQLAGILCEEAEYVLDSIVNDPNPDLKPREPKTASDGSETQ